MGKHEGETEEVDAPKALDDIPENPDELVGDEVEGDLDPVLDPDTYDLDPRQEDPTS